MLYDFNVNNDCAKMIKMNWVESKKQYEDPPPDWVMNMPDGKRDRLHLVAYIDNGAKLLVVQEASITTMTSDDFEKINQITIQNLNGHMAFVSTFRVALDNKFILGTLMYANYEKNTTKKDFKPDKLP